MSERKFSWSVVGAVAAWMLLGHGLAPGCDTPVYRYAMYRWEPAPYEFYYFHRGAIAEDAAALHKQIDEAGASRENPANLMLAKVDLDKDKELKGVPPDVRKLWQGQEKAEAPCYLVFTPHGAKLFQGPLDAATLKALLDSPMRRKIVEQLAAGKAAVLLLLAGSDKAANDAAEKAVQEVIADVASGKITVYNGPPPFEGEGPKTKPPPPPGFGYLRVARDDAAERWLVESLLGMDSELQSEELRKQPLLFGIFGRGRALPPFVGKDIERENLLACVDFVTGACSCTVKDQNPGVDLLIAQDWYAVAEKLAEKFGAEEGNEGQFSPEAMFPKLVVPAGEIKEAPARRRRRPTEAGERPVAAADATVPASGTPPEKPARNRRQAVGQVGRQDE